MAKQPYSDSEIARLLLLESQTYQSNYNRIDSSIWKDKALKTNKRFLKSVIRNVNDHNRQLERAPERSSTPPRVTEEEHQGRYNHRRKTNSHHPSSSSRLPEKGSRSRSRLSGAQGKASSSSREDETTSRQIEHRRGHSSRGKRRRYGDVEEGEDNLKKVCSHPGKPKRRTRERDKDHQTSHPTDLERENRRDSRTSKLHAPKTTSSNEARYNQHATHPPLPSRSKMDKYFAPSYDPRLDVNLDDITNPHTGLIEGGNYDDWELILAQMKAKREAKAREKEKKLEEKLLAAQRKLRKHEKRERRREKKRRRKEEDQVGSDSGDEDDKQEGPDGDRRRRKRRERRKERGGKSDPTKSKADSESEREKKEHRRSFKKRRCKLPSSDSDSSSYCSSDPLHSSSDSLCCTTHPQHQKIGLMDMKRYSNPGKPREWDLGKPSPT